MGPEAPDYLEHIENLRGIGCPDETIRYIIFADVNNLYKNVLGREADTGGLNYWLGQLNSGAETRYEVLLGFAESAENKALFTIFM